MRARAIALMRLAQLAREGGEANLALRDYVVEMERELTKFAPTHMAEVWRENERLKLKLEDLQPKRSTEG